MRNQRKNEAIVLYLLYSTEEKRKCNLSILKKYYLYLIVNQYIMKSIFTSTLLSVCFFLNAQDVFEKKVSMSLGSQNAYYIDVPGADKKMMLKAFEEMTKSYGKAKENKKAREYFMTQTRMAAINGSSPVDVYTKIEEGKGQSTFYLFVDMGGSFVNTEDNPTQSQVVKQFMEDYYVDVRKRVVSEELRLEEKKQADLEKDLRKLKEKKEDYLAEIEKSKQRIIDMEKNIEKNTVDQGTKEKEIETQKGTLKKVVEKLNNLGKKIE